eukprot:TRINITY_DN3086_c0_g1_i4.p1 TRINITY_DN3086_c0_g1~~TRINITY_DN3086_c0_g1_i4.p1  ORF type:complete len:798 (-),score=182.20 TRINITY_DN3086_c0_g1_i4:58-2451(-)
MKPRTLLCCTPEISRSAQSMHMWKALRRSSRRGSSTTLRPSVLPSALQTPCPKEKLLCSCRSRVMASTQFEATDARRAFPCWDEPAVKATFDVTMIHRPDRVSVSNMPVKNEAVRAEDGYKVVKFETTPKMSTYLLAFVVGEFDYVEGDTKEGVHMKVFTPVGAKEQGLFALDVGTRVLSYFTEYFGIGYPLPKCDMITIPNFSAGAMENWGLITYREAALLIDEKSSSIASKQNVAYIVAHELAHQWFGNLVTMEWWTHLWLNEGFATWVGNLAVAHLFPEWDIWTQFVTHYYNHALELDELLSSHPIEVPVKNSAEINEIFDTISYCKGASVIRMIVEWLGEETFRKGINLYLNKFLYGNAETDDLWASLQEASGKSVQEFMGNWTRSVGFPVVSVEQGEGDELKLTQERFLTTPSSEPVEDQKWWVGMSFTDSTGSTQSFDLKEKQGTLPYKSFCGCAWIKCNAGQHGFFRTKYSSEMLQKLKQPVLDRSLASVDRLGVQNDVFALSKAGLIPTAEALEFAEAYKNEDDYPVWSDLNGSIDYLSTLWSEEPNHPAFQKYICQLYAQVYQKLGWTPKEGESPLSPMLRSLVIATLGANGDKSVVETAKERFQAFLKDPSTLPADLKGVVYRLVVEFGGEEEYNQVLAIYRAATLPEERLRALRALGCARTPDLHRRSLEFSLSEEVRTQDTYIVIAAASGSVLTRKATWQFMKDNWTTFNQKFGTGQFLFGRMISFATSKFTTEAMAAEIEAYFAENPVPQAERTIKQSLESIRSNARWLARERERVAVFLQKYA